MVNCFMSVCCSDAEEFFTFTLTDNMFINETVVRSNVQNSFK